MILFPSDHIAGAIGYEVEGPIETLDGRKFKALTVLAIGLRRDNAWEAHLELLYTNNHDRFSPEDHRSHYKVPFPPGLDSATCWDFLRNATRSSATQQAPAHTPKEFHEYPIHGSVEKLLLVAQSHPGSLLHGLMIGQGQNQN